MSPELLPADQPRLAAFSLAVGVGLVCGLLHAVYAVSYVGLAFPGPLGALSGTGAEPGAAERGDGQHRGCR